MLAFLSPNLAVAETRSRGFTILANGNQRKEKLANRLHLHSERRAVPRLPLGEKRGRTVLHVLLQVAVEELEVESMEHTGLEKRKARRVVVR